MVEDVTYSWVVLIPPVIVIFTVIVSRRIILPLFIGLISSSILESKGITIDVLYKVYSHFLSIFYCNNVIQYDNLYIIIYLCITGTITSILIDFGFTDSFADKLNRKIKSRIKAEFMICCLAILFFIDDFFKCIALGAISRPIVDKNKIAREKLAYYIDSTAAPLCVLIPLSSWGAVIIAIMNNEISSGSIKGFYSGIDLFLSATAYNFYSYFSVLFIFIVALTNLNLGLMSKFERKAKKLDTYCSGLSIDKNSNIELKYKGEVEINCLITSITVLFGSTIGSMILSGYLFTLGKEFSLTSLLSNMLIGTSLLIGSICSLMVIFIFIPLSSINLKHYFIKGFNVMSPSIFVLILSWSFASSISELKIGNYIASLIIGNSISCDQLPLFIFLSTCFISFATGTSWGTFSLLIPIVCQILTNESPLVISKSLGALLGGGAFGDHFSPISSTSILASNGAGCNILDHFWSQAPYCILILLLSCFAYMLII